MLFGGPCRQRVKYDGLSLDLSGVAGPGESPVKVGALKLKRELVQTAAEMVQLLDLAQYSNCIRIEQTPRDSPDRIRLIYEAMESEKNLVTFALLMKALTLKPDSEPLQKAFASWVAAQVPNVDDLAARTSGTPVTVRGPRPTPETIRVSLRKAEREDPRLEEAMRAKPGFEFSKVLDALSEG